MVTNIVRVKKDSYRDLWQPLVCRILYPIHEKIFNRNTFGYLNSIEDSQWWDRAKIESLQYEKLKQLLIAAKQQSSWYQTQLENAGLELNSENPLTIHDLRKLPTLTRDDIQRHGAEMVCHQVKGGLHGYNTGGSSGSPLRFYFSRQRQASDAAGRMRSRRWWGVEVGDREVYLWGAPVELNKTDRIKSFRDRLFNQILLNAFNMSSQNMDDYIKTINDFNPRCIYGYASSLALLAAHAMASKKRLAVDALNVVCTTGEPVYPHQRALIEKAFGVPVANEFGSRDIGFTAHETPNGQMLLMSESHILEVLDESGQPVADGEVGEAVITGLCSDAQPFVRYRTGDMVKLSNTACKSGRGLHVIDQVYGRTTDFIVRSDGTIMHALSVIYVLRAIEGVGQFKLIQHSLRNIEVMIVPSTGWISEHIKAIQAGLQERLGMEVNVEVNLVDQIAPENSGKHRYVVSHVPLPDELNIAEAEI